MSKLVGIHVIQYLKIIAELNIYINSKQKGPLINSLHFHHKELEKDEQIKTQSKMKKEVTVAKRRKSNKENHKENKIKTHSSKKLTKIINLSQIEQGERHKLLISEGNYRYRYYRLYQTRKEYLNNTILNPTY